jgi:hypothetical protein
MPHTGDSNKGTSSGHTFSDIAVPNANAVDPGARNLQDPTWVQRHQQYLEATTPQQKFS